MQSGCRLKWLLRKHDGKTVHWDGRPLKTDFETHAATVVEALKTEGFGVLTGN